MVEKRAHYVCRHIKIMLSMAWSSSTDCCAFENGEDSSKFIELWFGIGGGGGSGLWTARWKICKSATGQSMLSKPPPPKKKLKCCNHAQWSTVKTLQESLGSHLWHLSGCFRVVEKNGLRYPEYLKTTASFHECLKHNASTQASFSVHNA